MASICCTITNEITIGSHSLFICEVSKSYVQAEHFDGVWNYTYKSPLLYDFNGYTSLINTKKIDSSINFEDMTWVDVKNNLKNNPIAILPIGSIEQHGGGLPLKTDSFLVTEVAKRAAIKTGNYALPTIYYGYNEKELDFPGTISVKVKTLLNYITDICESLVKTGFSRIVIINGHGWNSAIVKMAGHIVNENSKVMATVQNSKTCNKI